MSLRARRCNATPTLTERFADAVQIVKLECTCGAHGATLMYTKPEDRTKMIQAAEDGWNLSAALGVVQADIIRAK
ncbi:hypothetical protein PO883_03090 [Massilia sp. DJPM01]|uniref:hypothetical protein n=1 Tax=Massilia sp. DJPM01 TaxID=3024404 RepID=UPI00259FC87F|nr:hypothetical protein [Massilia sp. DJPM01]MDM5176176.1 hypothetical protein [Massilia sp. DJPM01]